LFFSIGSLIEYLGVYQRAWRKRDVLSKSSKENNSRRGSEGVGVIRGVFLFNQ